MYSPRYISIVKTFYFAENADWYLSAHDKIVPAKKSVTESRFYIFSWTLLAQKNSIDAWFVNIAAKC